LPSGSEIDVAIGAVLPNVMLSPTRRRTKPVALMRPCGIVRGAFSTTRIVPVGWSRFRFSTAGLPGVPASDVS